MLSNAIKFTDIDSVTVHIDVNHFSAEDIVLHFFTNDTGVGMSVAQLEKVFTPFNKLVIFSATFKYFLFDVKYIYQLGVI
ncbi:hypothetical protein NIES2101_16920 [Calothrix sp. HK-06]|nr:hypothetical protein NIES2101_16920 [Calothrix sp. HK-06]